jgi:RNA polymerase sigma-70 factor (ECF subfamily)
MSAPGPGATAEPTLDLVRRARSGDRGALDALCARYLPRLRRWAAGRLPRGARDRMDTDDLVQETLLRTIERLPAFDPRGPGAWQAYVRQALVNRLRDEARRAARRPPGGETTPEEPVDPGPSPLEEALGREALARYEAALAALSDEDREAVVARVELDGSYAEIAEVLGKPSADAARMAVARALLRLARVMADERAP